MIFKILGGLGINNFFLFFEDMLFVINLILIEFLGKYEIIFFSFWVWFNVSVLRGKIYNVFVLGCCKYDFKMVRL